MKLEKVVEATCQAVTIDHFQRWDEKGNGENKGGNFTEIYLV